ncbi:Ca2+ transporter [Trichoderma virens Gv29-8]|uniref:Ca2+ transporter n=1 Tax=Hypocrea virens (strain Gv29-8 / FGSC 10586) TaxID=413071 RepID=G9N3M8_HYPVG|nr:Ca2+ transporter [Trichoderma virens Gv29-8]EHK19032.1 Ca2+ transporter [Trichoderma virens Gv29-8]
MENSSSDIRYSAATLPAPVLGRDVGEQSPLLQGPDTCRRDLRIVLKLLTPGSYSNLLLVFIPLGITYGVQNRDPELIFWFNFLAIIPLSKLNLRKLRQLSSMLGPLGGGFLHAILDNALLLIVRIAAIQHGAAHIAQSCILGSVLANLLLVVGWCFLVGSIHNRELIFNTTFASTASSLMIVASTSLVVPSAISEMHCRVDPDCEDKLVQMSRSVSLALLFLFLVYQHYRWRSHRELFLEGTSTILADSSDISRILFGIVEGLLLISVLGLASMSAYFLMRTMSSVTDSSFLSNRAVSFVFLPLATDGPGRIEAIVAAYNNHMTTALEFAIGRSMNVALFITPTLVLFSWVAQSSVPMTLHFPTLETISIFLGTLLVAELCRDGKSDYLEGAMCLVTSVLLPPFLHLRIRRTTQAPANCLYL